MIQLTDYRNCFKNVNESICDFEDDPRYYEINKDLLVMFGNIKYIFNRYCKNITNDFVFKQLISGSGFSSIKNIAAKYKLYVITEDAQNDTMSIYGIVIVDESNRLHHKVMFVYIKSDCRRKGYAKAAIKKLEEQAYFNNNNTCMSVIVFYPSAATTKLVSSTGYLQQYTTYGKRIS